MKISKIVKLTAENNKTLIAKNSGDIGNIEVNKGDELVFYDYAFCLDGVSIDSWDGIENIKWKVK